MENREYRLRKGERLCSRKLIDRLYAEGHHLTAYPYSIQWMAVDPASEERSQVLVVAPKRKFRHAVDRNRVKRLTRECYRLRKPQFHDFLQEQGVCIVFSMVYIHHEIMSFEQLGKKMDKALAALEEAIGGMKEV